MAIHELGKWITAAAFAEAGAGSLAMTTEEAYFTRSLLFKIRITNFSALGFALSVFLNSPEGPPQGAFPEPQATSSFQGSMGEGASLEGEILS